MQDPNPCQECKHKAAKKSFYPVKLSAAVPEGYVIKQMMLSRYSE